MSDDTTDTDPDAVSIAEGSAASAVQHVPEQPELSGPGTKVYLRAVLVDGKLVPMPAADQLPGTAMPE